MELDCTFGSEESGAVHAECRLVYGRPRQRRVIRCQRTGCHRRILRGGDGNAGAFGTGPSDAVLPAHCRRMEANAPGNRPELTRSVVNRPVRIEDDVDRFPRFGYTHTAASIANE